MARTLFSVPQASEVLLSSHGGVIDWKQEAAGQCLTTTTSLEGQPLSSAPAAPGALPEGAAPCLLQAPQQSLGVGASPSAGPGCGHGWGTGNGSGGGSRHCPPPAVVALPFTQSPRLTTTTTRESSWVPLCLRPSHHCQHHLCLPLTVVLCSVGPPAVGAHDKIQETPKPLQGPPKAHLPPSPFVTALQTHQVVFSLYHTSLIKMTCRLPSLSDMNPLWARSTSVLLTVVSPGLEHTKHIVVAQ